MKTNYLILTTLALFIVTIGYAADTPKMTIVASGDEKALMTFESKTAYPVEITICTKNGEIVYYWKGETLLSSFNKTFNASDLGYGSFHVCLNYGGQSINRDLTITRKEITVGPAVELYEPFFRYDNNRLNLSFLNVAQKNVYLNIYQGNKFVSGVNLGKNMDIQKALDFSNLKEGEYEVVVSEYFKDHRYLVQK